ncbi:MAG: hypothetical protein LBG27_11975 [Spirochaetaceae bacterium]|jgi:5-methylcytosine-specific restriction protein B|nr:hypothetical protein [Spirochaetaceae bacterium]
MCKEGQKTSLSDDVRAFCLRNYVQPARVNNEIGFFIRSGDVHRAMGLSNQMPQVCSAIGSDIFEKEANVKRVYIEGPVNGARTIFVFLLNAAVCGE